jgi:diaminopimelate epimerase
VAERFFKYHGIGNDFVILDRRQTAEDIDAKRAIALCDRRTGIGADGVLVLLPSKSAAAKMMVHNSDGSTAEMCGNGLRCAARFLAGDSSRALGPIDVETGAGVLRCDFTADREVELSMGPARLVAPNLPSGRSGKPFLQAPVEGFPQLRGTAVSMGNPHLVLFEVDPERAAELGPKLEYAGGFPDRTNVEFARLEGEAIRLVVWERGAGLTQACGTGACATVAAAAVEKRLPAGRWVRVQLPGGALQIRVAEDLSDVRLRGPAAFVFEGTLPS